MYKKAFNLLFDFLFPKTKEDASVESLSEETLGSKINIQTYRNNVTVTYFFKYKDRLIKGSIWALKYRNRKDVATIFAEIMYSHILDDISDRILFENFDSPVLIPIPISKKRKRKRGYNQSEILATEIFKLSDGESFSFENNILVKNQETEHQARVNKNLREQNIQNTFEVRNSEKISGKNIILIDDVVTTGSTLKEARRVLLAKGARDVTAYVVAH